MIYEKMESVENMNFEIETKTDNKLKNLNRKSKRVARGGSGG